jgi:hypothetical protein
MNMCKKREYVNNPDIVPLGNMHSMVQCLDDLLHDAWIELCTNDDKDNRYSR